MKYISDIPKDYKPSNAELHIKRYLTNRNLPFLQEVRFEKLDYLRFDFYLPSLNTCIEFDGIQHFMYVEEFDKGDYTALEKRKFFDKQKTEFCKKNFIRLIRISYNHQNNISKILNRKLFPKSN
jgi:very-short-patch-repair endonuclease